MDLDIDVLIDELHDLSEDVPVALELPEHDEVVDAQEQLLMPLSRDFRDFLMTCTDVVLGSLEPVTVADPSSHTYLPEVTSQAWAEGLPREHLVLCETPAGYYAVNQDGGVFYWPRNGSVSDLEWETVWHWVRDVWIASADH